MESYIRGMAMGLGLIVAIGAQNIFVLAQGIQRQHHLLVAFICSLSDMALIFLGATSLGTIIAANMMLQRIAAWFGIIFLFYIGLRSAMKIFLSDRLLMKNHQSQNFSRKSIVMKTFAFTFLNPHVYLDTVLLLGSLAGQLPSSQRIVFAWGATSASFLWFFGLACGGALLAPHFANALTWRIFNTAIWITMWGMALQMFQFATSSANDILF